MQNAVLLNNLDHKDLRVIPARGARYGDDVMFAATFPDEFRSLQAHYPIVFRKVDGGVGFEALALFGFQPGENLFLNDAGWDAEYVPLTVLRQPFQIGVSGDELTMHIQMHSPRVSTEEGEPLFLAHGSPSPFLDQMNSALMAIHQGLQGLPGFVGALLELGLLESFMFDIELDDGSQNRLAGFYTINEDKLAALDASAVAGLHRAGYLAAIYMVVASLSNFRGLIARKNRVNGSQP
jgi:hypothetical protein